LPPPRSASSFTVSVRIPSILRSEPHVPLGRRRWRCKFTRPGQFGVTAAIRRGHSRFDCSTFAICTCT
jgi:hypothetical protein